MKVRPPPATDYSRLDQNGVSFDLETHKITPECPLPPVVCGAVASAQGEALLTPEQCDTLFLELLKPGSIVIGANIQFDMLVMANRLGGDTIRQVIAKYERGEVYDILAAQALDAIGHGTLGLDPQTRKPLKTLKTARPGKKLSDRYDQDVTAKLVLGYNDAKSNDYWRLRYAILEKVPMAEWPPEARQYPIDDVMVARAVALAQVGIIPRGERPRREALNLNAIPEICRALLALDLGAAWGFDVDQEKAIDIGREVVKTEARRYKRFIDTGWVEWIWDTKRGKIRLKANQSLLKRRVVEAYANGMASTCDVCNGDGCVECDSTGYYLDGVSTLTRTDSGGVSISRDVLADSGDPDLEEFGDIGKTAKIPTTYIPAMLRGMPLIPNCPLANERVSYAGVIQLLPRNFGVRACLRARPGRVFSSTDLGTIEFVAWAQRCYELFGFSDARDALNDVDEHGDALDVHSKLGAQLANIHYDEFFAERTTTYKKTRDAAKAGNFTYAGLGGAGAFVYAKRKEPGVTTAAEDGTVYQGLRLCIMMVNAPRCGALMVTEWKRRPLKAPLCQACLQCAEDLKKAFSATWRESRLYSEHINHAVDNIGHVVNPASGIIRGDLTFTAAANHEFSSRTASGAKRAMARVAFECFDPTSALWGSRFVAFVHDELLVEHPEDRGDAGARRVQEIMIEELRLVCPDVRVTAEPALMRRYHKGAQPVFDEQERLIPWEP